MMTAILASGCGDAGREGRGGLSGAFSGDGGLDDGGGSSASDDASAGSDASGDGDGGGDGDGDDGPSLRFDVGAGASGGDGSGEDGGSGACEVQQPTFDVLPPNVVLVLDKSGSMSGTPSLHDHDQDPATPEVSRWHALWESVEFVVNSFDGAVNFGAKTFPSGTATCNVTATMDVPVAPNNGPAILSALPPKGSSFSGDTPSQQGFDAAKNYLLAAPFDADPNAEAIVLVVDGNVSCSRDAASMEASIADALTRGITTFVVGIDVPPGSTLETETNAFALAGGAPNMGATTSFFGTADKIELQAAFTSIVGQVLSCDIVLANEPSAPDQTQVEIKDASGASRSVARIDESACVSGTEGWYYSTEYSVITLCGAACVDFKAAVTASVTNPATIEYFCPVG